MDNNRRVYGQYDRLFVETVEKLFIDMVLFTLKEVESESTNGCNKLIVIKQLDYLAKMLEAYVKTLPQTVDLGCLIDFVKQLKVDLAVGIFYHFLAKKFFSLLLSIHYRLLDD